MRTVSFVRCHASRSRGKLRETLESFYPSHRQAVNAFRGSVAHCRLVRLRLRGNLPIRPPQWAVNDVLTRLRLASQERRQSTGGRGRGGAEEGAGGVENRESPSLLFYPAARDARGRAPEDARGSVARDEEHV